MKKISREIYQQHLKVREDEGFNVSSREWRALEEGENYFQIKFENSDAFLSLIWQSIEDTKILTPTGSSRTLRDVVSKMEEKNLTWEELVDYNSWFRKCCEIDRKFLENKVGSVTVCLANDDEISSTPNGTLYIYEGVHKSLVVAKRLIIDGDEYQPITACLVTPRSNFN